MNIYIFEYEKKGHIFTNQAQTEIYGNRIEQAISDFKNTCNYDRVLNIYRVDGSYDSYVDKINNEKLNKGEK